MRGLRHLAGCILKPPSLMPSWAAKSSSCPLQPLHHSRKTLVWCNSGEHSTHFTALCPRTGIVLVSYSGDGILRQSFRSAIGLTSSVAQLLRSPVTFANTTVRACSESIVPTMISDDDLYRLANFLGSAAMVLIVAYHFVEVNSKDRAAVSEKEPLAKSQQGKSR